MKQHSTRFAQAMGVLLLMIGLIPGSAIAQQSFSAVNTLGLAHINISTTRLDESIRFYSENFGFTELSRSSMGANQLVLLRRYTCILELNGNNSADGPAEINDGVIGHFALEVSNLEQMIADLTSRGIEMERPMFTGNLFGGINGAFVRGPNGESIELFEYLDPSMAMTSMRGLPTSDLRAELFERKGPSVDFSHGDLKVSDNRRFLVHADGTPFLYLGDTAWELFHRLTREEAELYLENRRQKGFTVIQAVALAELDGLNTPNAYGDVPFIGNDPLRPAITDGSDPADQDQYDYWDHVDWIISKATEKGLYVGLLPTWGDKVYAKWGVGPVVFNARNARTYGEWIGNRYADRDNIIWINGGDRAPVDGDQNFLAVWRALAEGISAADSRHLMSYHTWGGTSTSQWFQNDNWLDFNMTQSGHNAQNNRNYETIARDYALTPIKPCMDSEPCYEDHAIDWDPVNGWFDEWDVRKTAYWGLLAGAHGTTYGCHPIWQFLDKGRQPITSARHYWYQVLDLPGAFQITQVRRLMESRPMLTRVPDQSLIAAGQGEGAEHIQAARGDGYAYIYIPTGETVTIQLGKISGARVRALWYNPRVGESTVIGEFDNAGSREFDPPAAPVDGNDWVLVLDDTTKDYPLP